MIYTSAIVQQTVQALIQVVFALDRAYFPGEKKLADALAKLPSAPQDFAARIQDVVSPGARPSVDELRTQSRGLADLVRETRALVADS